MRDDSSGKKPFAAKARMPHGMIYNRKSGATDSLAPDGSEPFRDSPDDAQLDNAGFQTYGYGVKKNTPFQMGSDIGYVETRPLNRLPPGMFIDNQDVSDIRTMPFKEIVETKGYPGDGWISAPSDKLGK